MKLDGLGSRRTLLSLRHAVVSPPAALLGHAHVTDGLPLHTLSRWRVVTSHGTLGALRHAAVSQPASAIRSIVTDHFSFSTLRRSWHVADGGADGPLRHAEGAIGTAGI